MPRYARLLILILLSALAFGAVAATSASASEYDIEGTPVTESKNVEGTSGHSLLAGTIGGVEAKVECAKDTFTGTIEAAGKGSDTLLLKECVMTKPAGCKVPATIEGKLKDTLLGGTTPLEEFLGSSAGETISEFTVSECASAGKYALTGTQTCELPKAEEELAEHEVVCKKAGSKLKLAGNAASFSSTEKTKLTTGKLWAILPVAPPRVEQVDFKENRSVLVDHQTEEAEEAVKINDIGGNDAIEWKSPKVGEVSKNWPVVYVQKEKVKLEVKLPLTEAAQVFLETKIEGEPVLTGEATFGGTTLKVEKKFNAAAIKANKGFLATGQIESGELPGKVLYALTSIAWKWEYKEKGAAATKVKLGNTTHNLYTLFKAPTGAKEIYLTVLDLDTLGIEKEKQLPEPTETEAIAGAWRGFSNVEAGIPSVHLRTYKPATQTGELDRTGKVLEYYGEIVKAGKSLTEVYKEEITNGKRATTCPGLPFVALLETAKGRCGAWAQLWSNALGTEGVDSEIIHLFAKFGEPCSTAWVCIMLVKSWGFGTPGFGEFPYELNQVKDEEGAAGQGVKNPPPFFWDHAIVKAGPKGKAQLYDPSYGTGPFPGTEVVEIPTEKSVLEEYQKKSIDGFCRSTEIEQKEVEEKLKSVAAPIECQKTPAALELTPEVGFEFP